jgi:hypothetical protein
MRDSDGVQCKELKEKNLGRFFFAIFAFFVVHFFLIAAFPRCDLYGQFISNRHAQ